ncbi:protein TRI1-like isoform X3 [Triticum dicoccoides]|uniref:protein TRI1-like isoform X3 n=1 Tax=Triticum dicoccoides TaxID=85692 RepID=UPI001891DA49|nr:protein TRI1-like isoform X3 [Triticum dicoccoides]
MSTAAATVFRGCRALMSSAAAAAAKGAKKPASAAAKPKAAKKPVDPNNLRGIMRPVPVSDALRKFGGAAHISRSGVLKIVWDYIKANDLQNPLNKREIICDEKLKTIFPGRDTVHMMEVTKLLSPHFVKTI